MRHTSIPAILTAFVVSLLITAVTGEEPSSADGVKVPIDGPVAPVQVGDVAWPEDYRPVDSEGWSIFKATPDTRILYVSSEGNDANAVVYEPGDADVGTDPFQPGEDTKPFRDINTALKIQRTKMPDWPGYVRRSHRTAKQPFRSKNDLPARHACFSSAIPVDP